MGARGHTGGRKRYERQRRTEYRSRNFAEPLEQRIMLAVQELVTHGSSFPTDDPAASATLPDASTSDTDPQVTVSGTEPVTAPPLSSRPGARVKLFLDFDGDPASSWNVAFAPPIDVPQVAPFDIDGIPTTFSGETTAISQIWAAVAEMFSPFDIDVTTIDPGNRSDGRTMAVIIADDGRWFDPFNENEPAGGIASSVGAFTDQFSNQAYVFWRNMVNQTWNALTGPRFIAGAIAHEAGHAFGLQHQSEYSGPTRVQEYSDNDPTTTDDVYNARPTAPIMGWGHYASRALWWRGPTLSATDVQDDLAILSRTGPGANGFGYRADDHPEQQPTALTRTGNRWSHGPANSFSGVIERASAAAGFDEDVFTFTTDTGLVLFRIDTPPRGAMLEPWLELRDDVGNVISRTTGAERTLGEPLASGTYHLVVSGGDSYGSMGQYRLSGTYSSPDPPQKPTADAGGPYSVPLGGVVMLDGTGSSDPDAAEVLSYRWDLDGDGLLGERGADAARGDENGATPLFSSEGLSAGVYVVRLRATNSAGLWSEDVADVTVIEPGVQTVLGDETEDDQWTVRYAQGNVQVFRRSGSSLVLEHEWPSVEVSELRFTGGGGDDRVSVFSSLPLTKVLFNGGDGNDTLFLNADNDNGVGGSFERLEAYGGSTVLVKEDLAADVVEVAEGSRLVLEHGADLTLRTRQLVLDPLSGNAIDVTDNELIIEGGDAAAVEALLASARDGGTTRWQGPGVGTSAATALSGLASVTRGDDLVVTISYNGDVNGDGRINGDDYFRIDQGFLGQPQNPLYAQGDFNFDDRINGDDYFLIDQAFLGQGQPLTSVGTSSPLASAGTATVTTADRDRDYDVRRKTRRAAPRRPPL